MRGVIVGLRPFDRLRAGSSTLRPFDKLRANPIYQKRPWIPDRVGGDREGNAEKLLFSSDSEDVRLRFANLTYGVLCK